MANPPRTRTSTPTPSTLDPHPQTLKTFKLIIIRVRHFVVAVISCNLNLFELKHHRSKPDSKCSPSLLANASIQYLTVREPFCYLSCDFQAFLRRLSGTSLSKPSQLRSYQPGWRLPPPNLSFHNPPFKSSKLLSYHFPILLSYYPFLFTLYSVHPRSS